MVELTQDKECAIDQSVARNPTLRFAVAATANCALISLSSETKQRQAQSISPWLSSEYIGGDGEGGWWPFQAIKPSLKGNTRTRTTLAENNFAQWPIG